MSVKPLLFLVYSSLVACLLTDAFSAEERIWGDFIEDDFPFLCHTLDARETGELAGITPRGIILKLGNGYFACFDPDLLRISLVWKTDAGGSPITLNGMAPGSYHDAFKKSPGGQAALPKPIGKAVWETGIHPGWFVGEKPKLPLTDPRTPGFDAEEVGRGPVSAAIMRWNGLELLAQERVVLRYEVGGREVVEEVKLGEGEVIIRQLTVAPGEKNLLVHAGEPHSGWSTNTKEFLEIPGADQQQTFQLACKKEGTSVEDALDVDFEKELIPKPAVVITEVTQSGLEQPYVIDQILAPTNNPWKRNVRLSGFDFFGDGRAAFCTFDGDVWLTSPIHAKTKTLEWTRFASGLNEPMALQIVGNEIYVFGRTCIWKLLDRNKDGTADSYENFSNLYSQTAESREFPNDMVKIPGGGFYIAKPGQLHVSRGHHNGTICKISPNGRNLKIVARGFRQPFIGYDLKNSSLTASDQQGNWVPATPIHDVQVGSHYGFLPPMENTHPQPVTKPLVWIPHFVNQSGASQITNHSPSFGPLSGAALHIGFNRPEIFRVYRDGSQGAVASVLTGFETGTLKGAVNPNDGQLYICGFRIWGTIAEKVTGFYRVRYTGKGKFEAPVGVKSSRLGVMIRFDSEIDQAIALNTANYQVDRWNYKRTSGYGSSHYKLDGSPGQETLRASSAYLSEDKKAVFLGIPDMKPSQSLRVTYRLPISDSPTPQIRSVYLTLHKLNELDLEEEGFGPIKVDLKPSAVAATAPMPATREEGERLFVAVGCAACHTTDGKKAVAPGPTWLGLYGSRREFADGGHIKRADEVYLRESILNPERQITKGYVSDDVKMPSYLGILQDYQIDSLILFIKSLSKKK